MSTKAEVVAYKGCERLTILYLTERKRDGNFVDKEVNVRAICGAQVI